MPIEEVYNCSVKRLQILDENGNLDEALFPEGLSGDSLVEMYKYMLLARAVDAKALSLQRQGRLATYAPLIGEEATHIGTAYAMRKQDIFIPAFRQHGVQIVRGLPLDLFFLYWRGFEDGAKLPASLNQTPVIVPVGTQLPHGAGIAFALKYLKKDAAAIVYIGDGGTSEGDFYEALNFAGVWKAPLVCIIENNQWAISVPRSAQTAAETLAQKAIAAGINCIQVDGNDVLAVYKATRDAIQNSKDGPMVIECVTYRMSMHTTSDDPEKYRPDAEVEKWEKKDPIDRIRKYLTKNGLWNDSLEQKTKDEQAKFIDQAVEKAEQFKPDPKTMFENVYGTITQTLEEELSDAMSANFWQESEDD